MLKPEHKEKVQKLIASHNGKPLDQKKMLEANPMIAKILAARFMSMSEEQQDALKKILTVETAEPLKVLLPEIKDVFDRGVRLIKRGMRNG